MVIISTFPPTRLPNLILMWTNVVKKTRLKILGLFKDQSIVERLRLRRMLVRQLHIMYV